MTLPVGVIGVGSMGANHARVYASEPETELVGVADADAARARRVAGRHGTTARSPAELLQEAHAVSLAVPTAAHADLARRAIDHGTHVLVEKPFVRDPEVGRELTTRADDAGVVLRVGHVERFNPAVETVASVVGDDAPVALRADRLGPPVDRAGSDGVVMDLMIHDIDVARTLVDGRVTDVSASAADTAHVTARLTFDTGTVATVTASRITHKRARRLTVTHPDRLIEAEYTTQSVRVHHGGSGSYESDERGVRYRRERVTDHPFVDSGEPLRRELSAFVAAVEGEGPGQVRPEAAIRAVEIARAVRRAAGREGS